MISKFKKRIYLVLEVQQRELDARIIFAIKAVRVFARNPLSSNWFSESPEGLVGSPCFPRMRFRSLNPMPSISPVASGSVVETFMDWYLKDFLGYILRGW